MLLETVGVELESLNVHVAHLISAVPHNVLPVHITCRLPERPSHPHATLRGRIIDT